jgi:hypothetical protein
MPVNDEQRNKRAKEVREAYREYLEWAKSLLTLAETTSISESPDQEPVLRKVFRLQILYNEREALRFEYLLRKCTSEFADFKSLSDVSKRLLKDWSDHDEDGTKLVHSNYTTVLQGIVELEGKTDSPSLDKPFQALTQNPNYRKARLAFAERIKELNESLG